ncbi:hypothetical protein B0O99DRAFT_685683 [Bisporella sp. PMI_857]|nr:hypothetical protein B0O99DRAFT_685683 [Bisporella sp. PMI_857]
MTHLLLARGLSQDNKINIILGVFSTTTGILSALLAWATWRLTRDRRHRHGHESPSEQDIPLQAPSRTASASALGYELAFRFGRST